MSCMIGYESLQVNVNFWPPEHKNATANALFLKSENKSHASIFKVF